MIHAAGFRVKDHSFMNAMLTGASNPAYFLKKAHGPAFDALRTPTIPSVKFGAGDDSEVVGGEVMMRPPAKCTLVYYKANKKKGRKGKNKRIQSAGDTDGGGVVARRTARLGGRSVTRGASSGAALRAIGINECAWFNSGSDNSGSDNSGSDNSGSGSE
jgi:hypothetical protein